LKNKNEENGRRRRTKKTTKIEEEYMPQTRQRFDQELASLQNDITAMAGAADSMVERAMTALLTGDLALVKEVVRSDDEIDQIDLDIEHRCLNLIVSQQPVAFDLRFIGTAMKIITDIERIGDYAVDIAKIGRRMIRAQEVYQPIVDLPHLADMTRTMLHEGLEAFRTQNVALARKVIADDDAVDDLYHHYRDELTHTLVADPDRSLLVLNVLFAAKYLERISDHVVNIAARVEFIQTGQLQVISVEQAMADDSSV